jgi:hypothetical protein
MRLLVRFKNKEITVFDLANESFVPPKGDIKGFIEIGKDKATGQPVVVHIDEVVAFEPQSEDAASWVG